MRITKTFEIEGYKKTFELRELKVKEIISLMANEGEDSGNAEDMSIQAFIVKMKEDFLPLCGNVTIEDIQEMTPSELKQVWEMFREVNASFFELARKVGLEKTIERLKEAAIEDFGRLAVGLLNQAISTS